MKSLLICVCSCATIWCSVIIAQSPPNFIFVLTDDQSYGMMGCTGNDIVQTPHLDQLAKDGILFDHAYVTSAICTPSRVSILLSQYERKHGVNFNSGTSIAPEAWETSYPVIMRKAGYYTGWIGKNHAPVGEGGYESGIMEKSFDYWYGGHGHLSFYPKERHKIFEDATANTQLEVLQEGINDFLDDSNESRMENAIRFLDQRPKDQPFLLSICLNLPHGAGTSTMKMRADDDPIYKKLYRDQKIPMPQQYIAKADIQSPKLPPDLLKVEDRQKGYDYVDRPETNKERYIRQFQAMTGIDRMIGKIRSKLNELKLAKNTILIFTSDHGLFMGEFGLGGKALCYEKTTHVPLIIYNPHIPKDKTSNINSALVQSIDIAPSILSMSGVAIPQSYQGKDLSSLLTQKQSAVRDYIYTENLWSNHFGNPRCEAVQDENWKYIRYYRNNNLSATKKIELATKMGINPNKMLYAVHDPEIPAYRRYIEAPLNGEIPVYEELFHLKVDPRETTNLVDNETFAAELKRLRAVWKKKIVEARGDKELNVLRYTSDSKSERKEQQTVNGN